MTGLPSTKINVFSGPIPRISIWRLFPRCPVDELPVKFTPGMVRNTSDISFVAERFSKSFAVTREEPSDCFT